MRAAMLARLSALDQRFSADKEAIFQKSLESEFHVPCCIGACVLLLISAWSFIKEPADLPDSINRFRKLILAFKVTADMGMLLVMFSRTRISQLRCISMEICVLIWTCSLLLLSCLSGRWHTAVWFGLDPYLFFGSEVAGSECSVFLCIASVTMFSCIVVPIRFSLSWIVPVCGLGSFGLVTFATSSPYTRDLPMKLFMMFAMTGFSLRAGFRNETFIRERWLAHRQVEKQKSLSEKQKQGFSQLLNRLCDCLVHLGPDLELTKPCSNLQAMLFLNSETALMGKNFCDYIGSAEDRTRFAAAVSDVSRPDSVGILPLRLSDSKNRQVQVHVYYTSFLDEDDAPYHIICIAEGTEREEHALTASVITFTQPPCISTDRNNSWEDGADEGLEIERTESSSAMSAITLETRSPGDFGEVAVTFDDSAGFNVLSCTPGFTSLCGPIQDRPKLLDWIGDSCKFRSAVQACVQEFAYAAGAHNFGQVLLRTHSAGRAGIEFTVGECSVDSISCVQTDCCDEPRFALRLRLDNISQRPRSSTSSEQRRQSRRSPSPRRSRRMTAIRKANTLAL